MRNSEFGIATDTSERNKRYSVALIHKKSHRDRKSLWDLLLLFIKINNLLVFLFGSLFEFICSAPGVFHVCYHIIGYIHHPAVTAVECELLRCISYYKIRDKKMSVVYSVILFSVGYILDYEKVMYMPVNGRKKLKLT